jgi:predicted transcriptional regulator
MAKITLSLIKRDHVRVVLEAIARKKHITKQEIAALTGLSLVTVGKITDTLGEAGIIVHGKNVQQKVGRRAEVLRVRQDWAIPVYDLSGTTFRFYITTLDGKIIDKAELPRSADAQYVSADFVRFLKLTLALLRRNYRNHKLPGVGVAIPGAYDAENDRIISTMMPEMGDLKLLRNFRKIFKDADIVIDNASRLCAAGLIEALPDYKQRTITCISFGDSIECTTCDRGEYPRGAHNLAGRLGDLPYVSGVTYTNFMHDALSTSVILEPALEIIRTAAIAYDPEEIYICSNRFSFSPDEVLRMQNRLAASVGIGAYPPKLHAVYNPEMEAMSGIISRVIGNWLDSMIVPQTRKKRKTADGADVNGETPTVAEAVADETDVSEDADA